MSHSALGTTPAGSGSQTAGTTGAGTPDVGAGPSFPRVLNSEFIKFRTLLSTLMLLGATMVVLVGFGALSAWGTGSFSEAAETNPRAGAAFAAQGAELAVGAPTSGVIFAQLILGALGVLLMSSEFTTGMARSTFAAVPRRTPAFVAKLIVVTVTAFVLTLAAVFIAGLVALPILENYNLPLDLTSSQSIKLMLVNSLYVAAVAAIGMSLGTLIRNSAGGIMSLVGLFFVAPIAFALIPGDFFVEARKYLPGNTLEPLTAAEHVPETLEVWQAALVLGGWVVIPVLLAGILLKRRDV